MRLIRFTAVTMIFTLGASAWGGGRARLEVWQAPKDQGPQLRSKIDFKKTWRGEFDFARVEDADPIKECHFNALPVDLANTIDELVEKVKGSISEVTRLQKARCGNLTNQLQDSRTQVTDSVRYKFLTGTAGTGSQQDTINMNVQRAGAVSSLINTATTMVDRECVTSLKDAAIIQKLIGQVITLAGLFVGDWAGVGISAAGLLISNLPLFQGSVERAQEYISKYEERNEKGNFLCLYRQMQRTSCMLFSDEKTTTIGGFDLTLKTGPAAVTAESMAEIKSTERGEQMVHDIALFRRLALAAEPYLMQTKDTVFKESNIEDFDVLRKWCLGSEILAEGFQNPGLFPERILDTMMLLNETCKNITNYDWKQFSQSGEVFSKTLWDSFFQLTTLREFYINTKKGVVDPKEDKEPQIELTRVLGTLESELFFEDQVNSLKHFRNPAEGNQERLNFLYANEKLGGNLARTAFKEIMVKDHSDFSRRRWHLFEPRSDFFVRKRAARAMLDLCQMFDPTLACLYPNSPQDSKFFRTWKYRCVGPSSNLCKVVLQRNERESFFTDPKSLAYFDSLCGVTYWKGDNSENDFGQ